jgi:branched-chain amino acid transport system permease protein
MSSQIYITGLVEGIGTGGIYTLVALGYNLVYASSGVFNFAQGDLLTYGGLLTATLVTTERWNVLAAVLPVLLSVGLLGLVQERITIAPLRRRRPGVAADSHGWIVTTLGASVILENVAQLVWGSMPRPVAAYFPSISLHAFGAPLPGGELLIIIVAVSVALTLELVGRWTLIGRAWRASAENPTAAMARGIPVRRVAVLTFVVAASISGLGGVITVPVTTAVYTAGTSLSLYGFVAIAIGGFGSQLGALIGGVVLGIAQVELSVALGNPGYQDTIALLLLLAVLLARPRGLFGRASLRVI